jgi:uncharacterized protein YaaR (DUF327 family)
MERRESMPLNVSNVGRKASLSKPESTEKVHSRGQDFSTSMDMANKERSQQQLEEMMKKIDRAGKRLITTRSVEDAKEYRRQIQDYLTYVVKNAYLLKKESSPFDFGVHTRIEIINKKLDEITKEVIEEQKTTIRLAEKIEELRGLLIDVYK